MPTINSTDREIIKIRANSRNGNGKPNPGDWVKFSDGVTARIAAISEDKRHVVLASQKGEFYLGFKEVLFTGEYGEEIPIVYLMHEERAVVADFYIYHDDIPIAENKVGCVIPVHIWFCAREAGSHERGRYCAERAAVFP